MRIAAIDIGSNSIHMVIAEARGSNGFEVIDREREAVQIGHGSFGTLRLRADAIRRTVDALCRFVRLARSHRVDRILCTATAAVREARNGGDFIAEARRASGITPRVIPAGEEGRLIYLAVRSAIRLGDAPSLIVDIGGGSVQLVVGNADRCMATASLPLGALRLTEAFTSSDPPSRQELQALRRHVRKTAREALKTIAGHRPRQVYGSSGTIHALAHIAQGLETGKAIELINGHRLSLAALEQVNRQLQHSTVQERERLVGIDSRRAEIIVPGGLLLAHLLEVLGFDGITVSDFGVREGLVTDYLESHARELRASTEDLRHRSVLQCLSKFERHLEHPTQVAKLSLALFDGLKPFHGLGTNARDLLFFAALLHDVGTAVGFDRHAEHSYYIIKHANLRGMTAQELEIVAIVARYHGKARPRKRDRDFVKLPKGSRRLVRWLSGMLRIVEGLDRSHYQLVRDLRVARRRGGLVLLVDGRREAQLELWAARRRLKPLERLLGLPVKIEPDLRARGRRKSSESARISVPGPPPRASGHGGRIAEAGPGRR